MGELRTKVFFDTEFTGLHKKTTLISIGLIAENGKTFYAELNDYDKSQIDEWLEKNVINNLSFNHTEYMVPKVAAFNLPGIEHYRMKSGSKEVATHLAMWLSQFGQVEMWSDCLSYDWVLFNDLFGTAFDIPKNVYYIPFDICTLFEMMAFDPDVSREEFCKFPSTDKKHNALHDAEVIKACHEKLVEVYTLMD